MARVLCVIPTHNRLEKLRRAVNSVLTQSAVDFSLVVVDDVGDNAVADYLDGLNDRRVSYLDHSAGKFKTAGSSRNEGARSQDSHYVAFLDDDDRWAPGYLEAMVLALENNEASLAVAWGSVEAAGERVSGGWRMPALLPQFSAAINPGITGSNFLMERATFERIEGFDESLPVFNDLDFFVRFLRLDEQFTVVQKELVVQEGGEDEHLSSRSEKRARGIEKYARKHASVLDRAGRRRLRREAHLARRFRGQTRPKLALHFVSTWLNSNLDDIAWAVSRRLKRQPRSYH